MYNDVFFYNKEPDIAYYILNLDPPRASSLLPQNLQYLIVIASVYLYFEQRLEIFQTFWSRSTKTKTLFFCLRGASRPRLTAVRRRERERERARTTVNCYRDTETDMDGVNDAVYAA